MNRLLIDDGRGGSRGLRGIGCRWLVGCGLMVTTGCAAQPIANIAPPDSLKARAGASAAVIEQPRLFGATLAASQQVQEHTLEPVAPGASGRAELAAQPEVGELEARVERLNPAPAMPEALASASFGADKLVVPPEAWRRPVAYGDPSAWQSALGAEFAAVTGTPLDQLDKVSAIGDASAKTLWRSTGPLTFGSPERLDEVFDDTSAVAGELARARAAGAEVAADRLAGGFERLSTMRLARGRVAFGFQGPPDSAMSSAGPGLTAHLGTPGRFPGKVDVGVTMGQGAPALAPLSNALGAAESSAGEHLRTFGLGEPIAPALDPGATGQQPAAGPIRFWIADRYGSSLKWWLSAGAPQDIWLGARPATGLAPEQAAAVDGGVQYDLGPEVAVVAAYRYRDDRADGPSESSRAATGAGERSDEQLHAASLRLIWRFSAAPPPRPAPAD